MNYEQFVTKVLSIAKIGLKFSTDEYALENYQNLLDLSLEALNEDFQEKVNENIFVRDIYPTPNVSVRVIILNKKNEILFVKESRDLKWGVPGGWCDLFLSPKENAAKEVLEEVGLEVKVNKLLAVFNREKYRKTTSNLSDYVMYFSAEIINDSKINIGFEVLDTKYESIETISDLSSNNTIKELKTAYDILLNKKEAYVD